MQLKLQRSQRDAGVISRNVIFCLDARVEFTAEEQRHITRYKLQNQVIYNSEASARHLAKAEAQNDGSIKGGLKSIVSVAMAAMKLNISIASLQRGQHVECKSLDELMGAEEAIKAACNNLKAYLDLAATFDGREVLFAVEEDGLRVIAHSGMAPPAPVLPPGPVPPALASTAPAALPPPVASGDSVPIPPHLPEGPPSPDTWPASSYVSDGQSPWEFWTSLTDGQRKLIVGFLAVFLLMILMKCGQR